MSTPREASHFLLGYLETAATDRPGEGIGMVWAQAVASAEQAGYTWESRADFHARLDAQQVRRPTGWDVWPASEAPPAVQA